MQSHVWNFYGSHGYGLRHNSTHSDLSNKSAGSGTSEDHVLSDIELLLMVQKSG